MEGGEASKVGTALTLAEFASVLKRCEGAVPGLPRQVIEQLEAVVRSGGRVYKWAMRLEAQESHYRDGDTTYLALDGQGKARAMWIEDRNGGFVEQVKPIALSEIAVEDDE